MPPRTGAVLKAVRLLEQQLLLEQELEKAAKESCQRELLHNHRYY